MKFATTKSELMEIIQTVIGTVPAKSAVPALSGLLLEAGGEELSVTASDLEISVRTSVSCDVQEEGTACVPARRLAEIVRELPSERVLLSSEGERALIECGRGKYRLVGLDPDDFPKTPEVSPHRTLTLDAELLRGMVRKCIYAVSTDETRPMLNGVLFELEDGCFGLVATDGHRLAYVRRELQGVKKSARDVIVPPKALNQLVKLATSGPVEVSLASNYALFRAGNTAICSRLLEGPFPDYKQVIPSKQPRQAKLAVRELVGAVRRVAVLADQTTRQIKLLLRAGTVEISTKTADVGEAVEEVPAEYSGEEFQIGFNASYLLDALATIDAEEVVMSTDTQVSPSMLWPAEQEQGEKLICLVMPVRLPEEVPVA